MSVELKKRSLRIGLKSGADPTLKVINFNNIKDKGDKALVDFSEAVAAITPPYGQTVPVSITMVERNEEVLEYYPEDIQAAKEGFFLMDPEATEADWDNWAILWAYDYLHPLKEEYAAAAALKDIFVRLYIGYGVTAEEAVKFYVQEYINDIDAREAYWPSEREQIMAKYGSEITEERAREIWLVDLGWNHNFWGPVDYGRE